MSTPQETFAAWLKAERARTGTSQEALASALRRRGISLNQSQVGKIERGEHGLSLDWAVAIAGIFGATLDVALGVAASDVEVRTVAARRTSLLFELKSAIAAELAVAR